jgi:hypothetical protein
MHQGTRIRVSGQLAERKIYHIVKKQKIKYYASKLFSAYRSLDSRLRGNDGYLLATLFPRRRESSIHATAKIVIPKLSDFLLDLPQSLAHQGSAKILNRPTGMPAVFANLAASRS